MSSSPRLVVNTAGACADTASRSACRVRSSTRSGSKAPSLAMHPLEQCPAIGRCLVCLAEVLERLDRLAQVLAVAQREAVEAHATEQEQHVAHHVADGPQLAPIGEPPAQDARGR